MEVSSRYCVIEYAHEIIVMVTAVVFTFVGHVLTAYNRDETFIGQRKGSGIIPPKNEPKREEDADIPKWADS